MSLIDQFEVQFNELSNFELSDGALTEVQPVEIAGVVNQEINRLEGLLKEFDNLTNINIFISNHDYKRLSKHHSLLKDGLEDLIQKTAKLKRLDNLSNASIEISQDSTLDEGIIKSVPVIETIEPIIEKTTKYYFEINGLKKELEERLYIVGRGSEADVQVNDSGISRKHLSINIDNKIVITDLDSTNGTFLNEERIGAIEADESIELRIGKTDLKIYRETK